MVDIIVVRAMVETKRILNVGYVGRTNLCKLNECMACLLEKLPRYDKLSLVSLIRAYKLFSSESPPCTTVPNMPLPTKGLVFEPSVVIYIKDNMSENDTTRVF